MVGQPVSGSRAIIRGVWETLLALGVVAAVIGVYALELRRTGNLWLLSTHEWGTLALLSLLLGGLLGVARFYRRLAANSDIAELKKLAFAYQLGGVKALRPFLCAGADDLDAYSSLQDYEQAIEDPPFLFPPQNPPFLLALAVVLALGLLAFLVEELEIAARPHLLLLGPATVEQPLLATPAPAAAAFVTYQSGALACVVYALLGAMTWSIAYLARRMALRDVTPHAFHTVTVRIVGSAIVALFLYHLLGPSGGDGAWSGMLATAGKALGMDSADLIVLVAFAAGMTPEIALRWLDGQARRLFGQSNRSDDLNLEAIEGIDAQTRVRLAEVGIYDAQGLVTANPLHLTLKTPFSLPQIMDWDGQAFLLVQLKPLGLEVARANGVRTAWQLSPKRGRLTAEIYRTRHAIEVEPVCQALQADPCYRRASEIVGRIAGVEDLD